ncbi:MAG: AAA family ATPase [Methanocellales archaeon]
MTRIIAVTGKGGTGKTAVSALLLRYLIKKNNARILAVDADADSNLPEALGANNGKTIGDVKEVFLRGRLDLPPGVDKRVRFEGMVHEVLRENEKYDLIVMGRPEGPNCYCYTNDMLRAILDKIVNNYNYVVIDTAAGLEHFSRRLIQHIDILIVVTDTSKHGLTTAQRIKKIAEEVNIRINKMFILANKVDEGQAITIAQYAKHLSLEVIGAIPFDEVLLKYDHQGLPLLNLPDDSIAAKKVEAIARKIGL